MRTFFFLFLSTGFLYLTLWILSSLNRVCAEDELKEKPKMLRGEGKSLVIRGWPFFENGRWKVKDQSPHFTEEVFIFLENGFLEEIVEKVEKEEKVEKGEKKEEPQELIIRGRYHFFQEQSYLLPTHLHTEEEVLGN